MNKTRTEEYRMDEGQQSTPTRTTAHRRYEVPMHIRLLVYALVAAAGVEGYMIFNISSESQKRVSPTWAKSAEARITAAEESLAVIKKRHLAEDQPAAEDEEEQNAAQTTEISFPAVKVFSWAKAPDNVKDAISGLELCRWHLGSGARRFKIISLLDGEYDVEPSDDGETIVSGKVDYTVVPQTNPPKSGSDTQPGKFVFMNECDEKNPVRF